MVELFQGLFNRQYTGVPALNSQDSRKRNAPEWAGAKGWIKCCLYCIGLGPVVIEKKFAQHPRHMATNSPLKITESFLGNRGMGFENGKVHNIVFVSALFFAYSYARATARPPKAAPINNKTVETACESFCRCCGSFLP